MNPVNILIVDDREENIIALEALLSRSDIKLYSTTSPNEALKIAWESNITIALVDVQMPEMDGFELVTMLKSNPRTKEILVIFVTAISKDSKYAIKGFSAGAVDYLYKPLDPYITSAKVDAFIQLARSQDEIKLKNEELIKLKEAAEQGKKVKEAFLANMSHELRTPINGILGIAGLLRKTEMNEQQLGMLNLLEVSSQSLLGVVNDVLDISKIEAGKFNIVRTAHNLHDIITSVFGLLKFKADEKNIEFILEISPNVPSYIMVDSLRLNQVLMNLLSNAIKFTERGYVKLSVKQLQINDEKVKLEFCIEDSGIGIADAHMSKIFNSFEQAGDDTTLKYGGTGLGLAIVKKLIDLKGGELNVSSEIDKGSEFRFTNWFIRAEKPLEKSAAGANDKLPPFTGVSILVAEDNMVNQFMITKILQGWNVVVDLVDDGRKAIDKLRQHNYDMILMDIHMPEMNGYEATKIIRHEFDEPKRSVPIISLSAATMQHEQQDALAAGMNEILTKPFQPHQLHKIISKVIENTAAKKQA
ncbi:MAG: response regulator [Sphingobacteriaceae bacterium]|nr:MAG: response regulator [Sphingobacteriaceae bacterium]